MTWNPPQPQQQPPWPPPQQPQQPPQWQPPQWQQQQPAQWGPPPQPPPGRRKRDPWPRRILGGFGALAVIIVIIIAASHGSSSPTPSPAASGGPAGTTAPAAHPTTAAAAAAAAADAVTYVVTGSPADVTYGPEGSSLGGSVPMRKTAAIPAKAPRYYSLDAQLNGAGTVTCEILVGGKVISQSTASGSYNIASCEITQGLFSSQWQDANS